MSLRPLRLALPILLVPLLAACVNDAASYQIEGRDHSLSIVREQQWFWDKTARLYVVASRMPACQRRHALLPAKLPQSAVDVFQTGGATYVLKQGNRMYLVETQTCEGFQSLEAEPPGGLGVQVGSFRQTAEGYRFVEVAPAAAEAASR